MFRIHRNHMSKAFSSKLLKEIHNIEPWEDSEHLWFKKEERKITDIEVATAIQNGEVIEYNELKGTRRVLLRDGDNVCVVVDLDTHRVITVFKDLDEYRKMTNAKYLLGH